MCTSILYVVRVTMSNSGNVLDLDSIMSGVTNTSGRAIHEFQSVLLGETLPRRIQCRTEVSLPGSELIGSPITVFPYPGDGRVPGPPQGPRNVTELLVDVYYSPGTLCLGQALHQPLPGLVQGARCFPHNWSVPPRASATGRAVQPNLLDSSRLCHLQLDQRGHCTYTPDPLCTLVLYPIMQPTSAPYSNNFQRGEVALFARKVNGAQGDRKSVV